MQSQNIERAMLVTLNMSWSIYTKVNKFEISFHQILPLMQQWSAYIWHWRCFLYTSVPSIQIFRGTPNIGNIANIWWCFRAIWIFEKYSDTTWHLPAPVSHWSEEEETNCLNANKNFHYIKMDFWKCHKTWPWWWSQWEGLRQWRGWGCRRPGLRHPENEIVEDPYK